ncbi:unnamed protein product [Chrysodeixis includens]|uniref:Uncharacterized protein n=1 Tax=Chrysodeixis includens TaxID=689277 RepID=A0A9P0G0U1_CHRIL|nr:unnamed protein product [Chrysodeixis includens]
MTSKHIVGEGDHIPDEEHHVVGLPPEIILNPREKIQPEKIEVTDLVSHKQEAQELKAHHQLVHYKVKRPPLPIPMSTLQLTWAPDTLCITMESEPVVYKLWIWNSCSRPIYMHVCGLWDETARFGASWCCSPRTRIWLCSGLRVQIQIKAKPREVSPVPCANAYLQIATEHMRDMVTGYFSIPLKVKFLNYVSPPASEG